MTYTETYTDRRCLRSITAKSQDNSKMPAKCLNKQESTLPRSNCGQGWINRAALHLGTSVEDTIPVSGADPDKVGAQIA